MRKVQIQVPDVDEFNEWVRKAAELLGKDRAFKSHGAANYTVTEVILRALERLAKEQDERDGKESIKKNKKS